MACFVALSAFTVGAHITEVSDSTYIFKRLSVSSYHSLKIMHDDQKSGQENT